MKHIKLIFGLATVVTAGIYDSLAQNANTISQQAYLKASNTGRMTPSASGQYPATRW